MRAGPSRARSGAAVRAVGPGRPRPPSRRLLPGFDTVRPPSSGGRAACTARCRTEPTGKPRAAPGSRRRPSAPFPSFPVAVRRRPVRRARTILVPESRPVQCRSPGPRRMIPGRGRGRTDRSDRPGGLAARDRRGVLPALHRASAPWGRPPDGRESARWNGGGCRRVGRGRRAEPRAAIGELSRRVALRRVPRDSTGRSARGLRASRRRAVVSPRPAGSLPRRRPPAPAKWS